MKYIIGNWKANKNITETQQWIETFLGYDLKVLQYKVTVIICPPAPFIPLIKDKIKEYDHIIVGSQDLSQFESGTYTGEITAKSIHDLIKYAIIGHSERRTYLHESDDILLKKIALAKKYNIESIYCVRGIDDVIPEDVSFVAYEPPSAISSGSGFGETAPIGEVLNMKKELQLSHDIKFIYGGSINPQNAHTFLQNPQIDGVLPGGASLDPEAFYSLAKAAL